MKLSIFAASFALAVIATSASAANINLSAPQVKQIVKAASYGTIQKFEAAGIVTPDQVKLALAKIKACNITASIHGANGYVRSECADSKSEIRTTAKVVANVPGMPDGACTYPQVASLNFFSRLSGWKGTTMTCRQGDVTIAQTTKVWAMASK